MKEERVVFFSKEDMAGGFELQKGEQILRSNLKTDYLDINDILELYHIKKYIDNELYLKTWTSDDISNFKQKVKNFNQRIGKFMSTINNDNIVNIYNTIIFDYIDSFWELFDNYGTYKNISNEKFIEILNIEDFMINYVLHHKRIVDRFNNTLKDYLLTHNKNAEILLDHYEAQKDHHNESLFLPKSLTIEDKEKIVSNYLDSNDTNYNYLKLIINSRNREEFKLSDKTHLKAKRLFEDETQKFFAESNGTEYGVSICFPEHTDIIKDATRSESSLIINYSYSLDFIKNNSNPHALFENFYYLFEYLDNQHRIDLVSKNTQLDVLEKHCGLNSINEYMTGTIFQMSKMTSDIQIIGYSKVLEKIGISLENTIRTIYTNIFHDKYGFANNARLSMPTASTYLEKVRFLAPEFESILKQYKLFVENGEIDFDLLEISSNPTTIKDIPSLNDKKYIYFNEDNGELPTISNIFFSDQTMLTYIEPFKKNNYRTFFDLLANEKVEYKYYQEYQRPALKHLIEKNQIYIDKSGFIQFTNPSRILILYDLYSNETASFYRYSKQFRQEAIQMEKENIIHFESSLFSKPEQNYFNYYLNKSEFTNGYDLRNKYLHGTQANPDKIKTHEHAYFAYLKLIVLTLLKMEDDLIIHNMLEKTASKQTEKTTKS